LEGLGIGGKKKRVTKARKWDARGGRREKKPGKEFICIAVYSGAESSAGWGVSSLYS
jgi:hypothetical protein